MSLNLDQKHKKVKIETDKERRSFLKKTAYAAPTLIVMGGLLRPTQIKAGFGPPPSAPVGEGV